jgi:DNA-binding transcriptional regulator YdaS (Cro superfamily)
MSIADIYHSLPPGGRQALAERIGIAPAFLYQIATGRRSAPARLCRPIEQATNGAVTVHELRPDIFGPAPEERAA